MANEAQLKKLKQRVAVWNRWRESHPQISIDLSEADLREADLNDADLSGANLRDAVLCRANLHEADLSDAVLCRADLSGADLSDAVLCRANLFLANLSGANLFLANLSGTNLSGTNLSGANLSWSDLDGSDLYEADLSTADLSGANCERADFSNADLALARLVYAKLNGATLTRANLWETQRLEWSIQGVVCESVYLEEKRLTTFAPGEFERLYSNKTKIHLFYKDGLSPLEFSTLPALVNHLESSCPGCTLRLESINDVSGGAAVTLAIDSSSDSSPEGLKQLKAELEAAATQVIEYQRIALAERETRLQLEGEVKQLSRVVDKFILRPSLSFYREGDTNVGDTYNTNQAGAVGPGSHAHDMTFNRIERSIDLSELAGELSKLREALSQEAEETSHYIALGEVAKAEEAAKAKDSSKVVECLKAAGRWTLDVATKIGTPLASEAIKQALGMK